MTYDDPFGNAPFGQYPGGPPVVPAPPPPPSGEVNTFATLSLIFAFVFAPAGAVLGHLGLAQIKRTGQKGRDRALAGTVLSYVVIVISVVVLAIWAVKPGSPERPAVASSTLIPTTEVSPGPVVKSQLAGLLLSLADIKRISNAPNNYTVTNVEALNSSTDVAITPPQCATALISGATEVYRDSAMTATRSQTVDAVKPITSPGIVMLEQRVTLYRSADEASRQVDSIAGVWRTCAGPVTVAQPDGTDAVRYDVGDTARAAGDPSMTLLKVTKVDSPAYNLRAVAAKENAVVDVSILGANLGDAGAADIATALTTRIRG